jgi:hypothetical protein
MFNQQEVTFRMLAVISFASMWISGGALFAQTEGHSRVSHEDISISLPVYISSIIATAVFTWIVSKYDNARTRRVERVERKLDLLLQSNGISCDDDDNTKSK